MNVIRPVFVEGIHWENIPADQRHGTPWKYRLLQSVRFQFNRPISFGVYYLLDGDGTHWGTIAPNSITVSGGYAWNGSTCSPDHGVLAASLVHDLLYQFSGVPLFPFSRNFCDNLFYSLAETPLAFAYRAGLFLGGWTCWGQHAPGAHIIYP